MLLLRRAGDWPTPGWRNPFEELERIRRQMDTMSTAFLRGPFGGTAAGVFPMMNVTEDKDNYYVRAELPGIKADELAIDITANTFSITGERKLAVESEKAQYHRREREAGTFNRIVTLPAEIDAEKVEARCTDGVLTVILPKAEAAKPKRIAVKSS
jgi:HSP20 family protein